MSKTVSTRLQNKTYEQLIGKCNEKGITVNEFLKECIKIKIDNLELKTDEVSKPIQENLNNKDLAKILGINMNQK
jgi:predicted DNA-binding protein